jgi:hypothetical protein
LGCPALADGRLDLTAQLDRNGLAEHLDSFVGWFDHYAAVSESGRE